MSTAIGKDEIALFTDLYELTMLQGYWKCGRLNDRAAFEMFYRRAPEGGAYAIACGVSDVLDLLENLRFTADQLEYLASLGMFEKAFLDSLADFRFTGDIRAVDDGTLVFPHEPLIECVGPLPEVQLIETLLLNVVNFQTLIATKACRMVRAARRTQPPAEASVALPPASVIEFGMRRAQGPNGAMWASKASYVGGCIGTSNVLAGMHFGIPVYGTHAHSWVMSFDDELSAFRAYAMSFPDRSVLLIDTYDTLESGLPAAIAVGRELVTRGFKLHGVRLDSGDMLELSRECRSRLDAAGLKEIKIVASGDLDEYRIERLRRQGAPIDLFGVGTRLVTAFGEPALGGVYKLAAIQPGGSGPWFGKHKRSSEIAKATIPGRKQVWRECSEGEYVGDLVAEIDEPSPGDRFKPLLIQRMKNGRRLLPASALVDARQATMAELARLDSCHQEFDHPALYPVRHSAALRQPD